MTARAWVIGSGGLLGSAVVRTLRAAHRDVVEVPAIAWGTPRAVGDLPSEARLYLDRIEALVEAPITYVSVGTRRDQIIGL